MGRIVDLVNIVDIESTCWHKGKVPNNQRSNIIEVGIVTYSLVLKEIIKEDSILIRPQDSEISDFCQHLTGITQQEVDQGISLEDAFDRLRKEFKSHTIPWASWGMYDYKMFASEADYYKLRFPFNNNHFNIKVAFGLKHELLVGVPSALQIIGETFEGSHHRALPDALNILKLFKHLI